MTVMLVVGGAVALVLLLVVVSLVRRPSRGVEAHELSAYHDGLDALTRLDARRSRPS